MPKKIERNKGIRIRDKGIKNLKVSSNFKELDIQYKFEKKYPKPNNNPKINKYFLLPFKKLQKMNSKE